MNGRGSTVSDTEVPTRTARSETMEQRCQVCGGGPLKPVWRDRFDLSHFPRFGADAHGNYPDSRVVACPDCGFGQPETLPDIPDYFRTLYRIEYPEGALKADFESGVKDAIFREVLGRLDGRLAADVPRTVLDIGCHTGRFLQLAAEAGWEAEGIELNPETAAYARTRTGRPVHACGAEDLAAQDRTFGALVLTDVLEHIPDPVGVLRGLRPLVAPGGAIAVKVPHGPAQRLKERLRRLAGRADAGVMVRYVHVNHFTVKSLDLALRQAGFKPGPIEPAAPEGFSPLRFAVRAAARGLGPNSPLCMNLLALAGMPRP